MTPVPGSGSFPFRSSITSRFWVIGAPNRRNAVGGEQQQLAITRALAGDPSVLIPDEPFEGIQPNLVPAIADRLNRLAAESGIAILLIERNLDAAVRFAKRCVFMEGGRIVHDCPAGDLRDPSLVDRLPGV